jgi:hypothetical protein
MTEHNESSRTQYTWPLLRPEKTHMLAGTGLPQNPWSATFTQLPRRDPPQITAEEEATAKCAVLRGIQRGKSCSVLLGPEDTVCSCGVVVRTTLGKCVTGRQGAAAHGLWKTMEYLSLGLSNTAIKGSLCHRKSEASLLGEQWLQPQVSLSTAQVPPLALGQPQPSRHPSPRVCDPGARRVDKTTAQGKSRCPTSNGHLRMPDFSCSLGSRHPGHLSRAVFALTAP